MPEEAQKDTNEEVVETPQGEEQPEELSTSEEPAEVPQETDTQEGEELPEDAPKRTKEQFDKLKQHNAELKRQLEERKQLPSVLDFLGPSVPQVTPEVRNQYLQPQAPSQVTPAPELVDEQGYVNADVLKSELALAKEARIKAEEAERRAVEAQQKILRYEQDAATVKLYEQYPELNPQDERFNQDAYDLVRNELTSQIVNTGNRDAIAAATKMSKFFRQQPPKNEKVVEQRQQATTATGTNTRQSSTIDLDELKIRSRTDPNAVAERLRRLGI